MVYKKYLAPNGKTYTESQLDRLSIKTVFDFLKDLGVADKSQYTEFKRLDRRPTRSRSRTVSRPRSRTRYVYVNRPRSPRYRVVYRPRAPRYVRVRSRSRPLARRPAIPSPAYGCPSHRNALQCRMSGCYWTGASCLTP